MRVLIAGCGDVGNVLATTLMRDGHLVYGLKRDTSTLPEGTRPVRADLLDPATLTNLPSHIDRLVYMPTPASRDQAGYEAIFIRGWSNLWASLAMQPARCLLVSSTAVYGESGGAVVNEETEPRPTRFNGRVLLDMERLARQCAEHLVVARISGIYGPGRDRLIRLAASSGLEVQQFPPEFTNRIHLDDAAAALRHLLEIDRPDDLYLVTDDLPAPRYDVLSWLAKTQGHEPPKGLVVENAAQGKRVSNRKLRESGFSLTYPDYRSGYTSVLEQRSISLQN